MSTEENIQVLTFYEGKPDDLFFSRTTSDSDDEFISGITIGQVDAILVDMNKKINQAVQDANDAVGDKIEVNVPHADFEVTIKN